MIVLWAETINTLHFAVNGSMCRPLDTHVHKHVSVIQHVKVESPPKSAGSELYRIERRTNSFISRTSPASTNNKVSTAITFLMRASRTQNAPGGRVTVLEGHSNGHYKQN
jgi:hypothetical protein